MCTPKIAVWLLNYRRFSLSINLLTCYGNEWCIIHGTPTLKIRIKLITPRRGNTHLMADCALIFSMCSVILVNMTPFTLVYQCHFLCTVRSWPLDNNASHARIVSIAERRHIFICNKKSRTQIKVLEIIMFGCCFCYFICFSWPAVNMKIIIIFFLKITQFFPSTVTFSWKTIAF